MTAALYRRERESTFHCELPHRPHVVPTKYPLPVAFVSFFNCHFSHATAVLPNAPPLSSLYVPP